MNVSARSYLTAGVAAFGAGAIALAPVQPLPQVSTISPALRSSLAVDLVASIDPITPWVDTFQTASQNIERLFTLGLATPLPIITQIITNFGTYLSELPDIGTIIGQVFGNVGNALGAPFAVPVSCSDPQQGPCESISTANVVAGIPFLGTLNQQQVFALLPGILPEEQYASLKPILDFTTSPLSGVLLGSIGPVVAPVLSVVNSLGAILDSLGASDFEGAINELINIPANAVNAFLNGGPFLDLAPVLSLVGVTLPDSISSLGFNMGGLLSTGISPAEPTAPAPLAEVMFDGLGFTADLGLGAPITNPGLSVGPISALIGLNQKVAEAIAVTPPAEAPAEIAAAVEAPAIEAVGVEAPAPAPAPRVTTVEVSAPVSEPAQEVAARSDTAPAAPRASRAGRGGGASSSDEGSGASTPKRSARAAASRG